MNTRYQGCQVGFVGPPAEAAPILNDYEQSGEWVAEPKLDGQWVLLDGQGRADPPVVTSRSGRMVRCPLSGIPAGILAVGEYVKATGTVHVFDVLRLGSLDVASLPMARRRSYLESAFRHGAFPPGYQIVPQWQQGLMVRFSDADEGLVLKRLDDGAYQGGRRNPAWLKVKKSERYRVVVETVNGRSATIRQGDRDCGSVNTYGWPLSPGTALEIEAYNQYPSGRFRSPRIVRIGP